MNHKNKMRLLQFFIFPAFLLLTACAKTPEISTPTSFPTPLPATETPSPTPTSAPKLDSEALTEILTASAGSVPVFSLCDDFDHNGSSELFAVIFVEDTYQIWYCNSDGTLCEKVHESTRYFDECYMTTIPSDAETHIVVNLYNMMGPDKQFTILALQKNAVACLVPWHYGTAGTDSDGQPCMTVDAYDGCYDATLDMWLMHTWKQTWLKFDKNENTYREIAANKITEDEFLTITNSAEYLEKIRNLETSEELTELSLEYFYRENGILHVQCYAKDKLGNISARYYTLKQEDDCIGSMEDYPTNGIMQERLSELR